ncbi:MAG: ribbon-helix-helix protein, CopG family [Acidobacteriota bacterium]
MRRTQLYLDDQLWEALHANARSQKTTISELVRAAVRSQYIGSPSQRLEAMRSFAGSRPAAPADSVEEVRSLRRGNRLEQLRAK